MFTFGNALTLAGFATTALQKRESYNADVLTAQRQNQKIANDRQTRLATLARNQELIGQEKMLEMISFGFDSNLIFKQTRAAKATALAKFSSFGSLSSQSLNMHVNNIARAGAEARKVRSYNYGTRVNRLGVEAESLLRATIAANKSANFLEAPSSTGLSLANLGLGISAFNQVGFKKDPESGKSLPSFGTGSSFWEKG
tara:strand:+ start:50 stop:646 length:597 start_codon:yes stop_codon:yes gene_type:complete